VAAARLMQDVYRRLRRKETACILPTDHLTW
jgi:hypothetical protein